MRWPKRINDINDPGRMADRFDFPFDTLTEDPTKHIGKTVEPGEGSTLQLLPYDGCPKCESYSYRVVWIPGRQIAGRDAWWICERCEYQTAYTPGEEEGEEETGRRKVGVEVHNPRNVPTVVEVNGRERELLAGETVVVEVDAE